jgi:hypothetical protein
MTARERWQAYLREDLTSPEAILGVFGAALGSHLSRDPREWGGGARGYFHRLEYHMERSAMEASIHGGMAAVMGYDTRYHRYPGRPVWLRASQAVKRVFLTYDHSGHLAFDLPGLAGIYGNNMLSTYWVPHRRPLGQGVRSADVELAVQGGLNLGKEFGPDLKRMLRRKPRAPVAEASVQAEANR